MTTTISSVKKTDNASSNGVYRNRPQSPTSLKSYSPSEPKSKNLEQSNLLDHRDFDKNGSS